MSQLATHYGEKTRVLMEFSLLLVSSLALLTAHSVYSPPNVRLGGPGITRPRLCSQTLFPHHMEIISWALVSSSFSMEATSAFQASRRFFMHPICSLERTLGWTQFMCTFESTWSMVPFTRPRLRAFITSSSTSFRGSCVSSAMSLKVRTRWLPGRRKVISIRHSRHIFWRRDSSRAARSGCCAQEDLSNS
uniref:Putative secreted protein n=1 Tax=Ixodes ricinus TaxID=34613 RepID=A0A6B0V2R6_IXORI